MDGRLVSVEVDDDVVVRRHEASRDVAAALIGAVVGGGLDLLSADAMSVVCFAQMEHVVVALLSPQQMGQTHSTAWFSPSSSSCTWAKCRC